MKYTQAWPRWEERAVAQGLSPNVGLAVSLITYASVSTIRPIILRRRQP
jgi:hypothetical protein